jgi:hypothetical protein
MVMMRVVKKPWEAVSSVSEVFQRRSYKHNDHDIVFWLKQPERPKLNISRDTVIHQHGSESFDVEDLLSEQDD